MKEFALNHPWMTFFLIDGAITAIVNIVRAFACGKQNACECRKEETKEETSNESSGDIQ